MESVTVGSANVTPVTSATTVTAPQRRRPVFLMTGRCAAGGATVCVAAVSVQSQGPLEIPVKNVPPALMPVALRGKSTVGACHTLMKHFTNQSDSSICIYVMFISLDGG